MLVIELPGPCVPKGRPRLGRGGVYTPEKTRAYERLVRDHAALACHQQDWQVTRGPVSMTLYVTLEPPQSWSKKKRQEAMGRYIITKPDLDNYEKAVCDGMEGIVFLNDSQVADCRTRKVYGPEAKTVVIIEELPWLPSA